MPLSAASIPNTFLLLILLVGATASAAASVPAGDGDVNTTVFTSGAATSSWSPLDDDETYICYLCTGRNPLLIRYCPMYWDECHLVCYDGAGTSAAASAIPAAAAPRSLGPPADAATGVDGDECYVMKLYPDGSYTIVSILWCSQVGNCHLSCGGGDVTHRNALGAAAAGPATTAAIQGSFPPPHVLDFERCGTQINAP